MDAEMTIWMWGEVGLVSPAPDFSGTRAEAMALLRKLEQENAHLKGQMVVGPRSFAKPSENV